MLFVKNRQLLISCTENVSLAAERDGSIHRRLKQAHPSALDFDIDRQSA